MTRYKFFGVLFLFLVLFSFPTAAHAAPNIANISAVTTGNIEKYANFEVKFNINGGTFTNPFFPYDATAHSTWTTDLQKVAKSGISVDMILTAPDGTSKSSPCFYFQPYEEVGGIALLPKGAAEWRCRFAPEKTGTWQYKIHATDAGGTSADSTGQFTVVTPAPDSPTRRGFVKVSTTDPRFFEFSNGEAFTSTLINQSPGDGLTSIRDSIQKMGQGGVHFIRWFATGEGGNIIAPYGDDIRTSWGYSGWGDKTDDVDTANGKHFSFAPFPDTSQAIPAVAGAKYRLTFRAHVVKERVLVAEFGSVSKTICSVENAQYSGCDATLRSSNWHTFVFDTINSERSLRVNMSGLYMTSDYGDVRDGSIRLGAIKLQKCEANPVNSCDPQVETGWGPNLLARSDPDSIMYVDQVEAAKMDELFRVSEIYGVCHKLTLFWKEALLSLMKNDGTVDNASQSYYNFYSSSTQPVRWLELAYARYFVARWSYSTALHSLELANENDPGSGSWESAFSVAKFILDNSPRHILQTNSFWAYFVNDFFMDSTYGYLMDYGDKHWYAVLGGGDPYYCDANGVCETMSKQTNDSAAYERECALRFDEYAKSVGSGGTYNFNYKKPIVRGEGASWFQDAYPSNGAIADEINGTYYHKKLWAHVGTLGYSCDGEFYPRLFESDGHVYPNATNDTFKIYKTYETFTNSEPLSNGTHVNIGTDNVTSGTTSCSSGENCIKSTNSTLRAFGSKDKVIKRVLVWVDNKNNTWTSSPGGATSASGTFTVSGMPAGSYTRETWDTRAGTHTTTANAVTVAANGELTFTAATGKDVAYKFYVPGIVVPTSTPTSAPAHCTPLGDIDCSGKVTALDLSTLLSKFNTADKPSDLDDSGQVNTLDLFKSLFENLNSIC